MEPLFRPSILLSLLTKAGVFPKKSLSQNFLIDGNIVKKIIQAAEILPQETILEIGAGSGVLTQALLEKNARIVAIEKDAFFASHLCLLKKEYPHLQVVETDVLDFVIEGRFSQKIKVVSNLPYHLTFPLLLRLLEHSSSFTTLFLMLQKEAVERLLSLPGSKNYGALSVLIQFYSYARPLFDIPSSCFYPVPKVSSTLLELRMKKSLSKKDRISFHSMVFKVFQQRRKKILSSLRSLFPQENIKKALCMLSLKETARPEELEATQFFSLWNCLLQKEKKKIDAIERKT